MKTNSGRERWCDGIVGWVVVKLAPCVVLVYTDGLKVRERDVLTHKVQTKKNNENVEVRACNYFMKL